jgi:hypothetical protein
MWHELRRAPGTPGKAWLADPLGDLGSLGGSSFVHTRSNNKKGAATAAPFGMPDRV